MRRGRARIEMALTDSIFRRYPIVDEELLAQATGAVAELRSREPNWPAASV